MGWFGGAAGGTYFGGRAAMWLDGLGGGFGSSANQRAENPPARRPKRPLKRNHIRSATANKSTNWRKNRYSSQPNLRTHKPTKPNETKQREHYGTEQNRADQRTHIINARTQPALTPLLPPPHHHHRHHHHRHHTRTQPANSFSCAVSKKKTVADQSSNQSTKP